MVYLYILRDPVPWRPTHWVNLFHCCTYTNTLLPQLSLICWLTPTVIEELGAQGKKVVFAQFVTGTTRIGGLEGVGGSLDAPRSPSPPPISQPIPVVNQQRRLCIGLPVPPCKNDKLETGKHSDWFLPFSLVFTVKFFVRKPFFHFLFQSIG
jgi:hypothetical protein